jgi:hypothetical protein
MNDGRTSLSAKRSLGDPLVVMNPQTGNKKLKKSYSFYMGMYMNLESIIQFFR